MQLFFSLFMGVVFFSQALFAHNEKSLEEEFQKYVPKDIQKRCKKDNTLCKKFYIGYSLVDNERESKKSIAYLVEVYENNNLKIVEDMEAKPYYLTMTIAEMYEQAQDFENAQKYFKLALKAGNKNALCSLGNLYKKEQKKLLALYFLRKGAEEHIAACYTNLGLYYFNDQYGGIDKELGGKYWKLAYWDSSYGTIENYNLGVYYEYKKDFQRAKYHTQKAAYLGDSDAQEYLKDHFKNSITSPLFIEEVLGSKYRELDKKAKQEFSTSYDIYYRMTKMLDRAGEYVEDEKSDILKFERAESSFLFGSKKISLTTQLTPLNRDRVLHKDIQLLYQLLFIDLEGVPNVVKLHHELIRKIAKQRDFHYSRLFYVDGFPFTWSARYNAKSNKLYVAISL